MGREILENDLPEHVDIDLGSEAERRLYARRLACEIEGEQFVSDPDTTPHNHPELDRDRAIDKMERILKYMHKSQNSGSTSHLRGIIENQDRFEFVAGRPIDEALEDANEEFEEYDLEVIGKWFVD